MPDLEITDWMSWIFKIFFYLLAVFLLLLFFGSKFNEDIDTNAVEKTILMPRIVQSLSYQDIDTMRIYYGYIDKSKLNQKYFNDSFPTIYEKEFAFKIQLFNSSFNQLKELYYNKEFYDYAKPLTFSKNFESMNETKYLFLKEEEELEPVYLKIDFVFKK